MVSKVAGINERRITLVPTFLSVSLLNSSPALKRITINAISLRSDDTANKCWSSKPGIYGPKVIPTRSINMFL